MSIPKPTGRFVDKLLGIHWPSDGREDQFDAAAAHYLAQCQVGAVDVADQLYAQAQTVTASSTSEWVDASVETKRQLARNIEQDVGGWLKAVATQHRSIASTIRAGRSQLASLAEQANTALEEIDAAEQAAEQAGDAAKAAELRQIGVAVFMSQAAAIAAASHAAAAEAAGFLPPLKPTIFQPVGDPTGGGSSVTFVDDPSVGGADGGTPPTTPQQVNNTRFKPYDEPAKPDAPQSNPVQGEGGKDGQGGGSKTGARTDDPDHPNKFPGYEQGSGGDPSKTGNGGGSSSSGGSTPSPGAVSPPVGSAPIGSGSGLGSGMGAPSTGTPSAASLGSPASSLGSGVGKVPGAGLGSPPGATAPSSLGAGPLPSSAAGTGGAGSGSGGSGSGSNLGALSRFTPPVIPPAAVTQAQQQPTSGGVSGAAPAGGTVQTGGASPAAATASPATPTSAPPPVSGGGGGGGAVPMMTSPAAPTAGGPLAPAGSATPQATPIHQGPATGSGATPPASAPGSSAAAGPGGVLPAGAGTAAGYYGAGPVDPGADDLAVARKVLSALLVSSSSYFTEFAVGVFAHAVAGRHVVVMSTSGRSYLPPPTRVFPGVSIARTDPHGGEGWDIRFSNFSRPVDGLVAYAAAAREQLTWTAVATSVAEDSRPPGVAFGRVGRPSGQSQPDAVPQGLHRLDATWPELARRAHDVPAGSRVEAAARIVDRIVQSASPEILEDADVAMVSAIASGIGAVPSDQWNEYAELANLSIMAASLAGRAIGASSAAADAALGGEADTAMRRMLFREAILCLRDAPSSVALEDLVYVAMHLDVDPLEMIVPQ